MCARVLFYMRDDGAMAAAGFGGSGPALTTGLTLSATIKGETVDLMDGEPIKNNAGFGRIAFDVARKAWGAGDVILVARYALSAFVREGLRLTAGDSIDLAVSDDLSGITEFRALVQGEDFALSPSSEWR